MAQAVRFERDAERSVIGAVLLRNDALGRVRQLAPADFFDPRHRLIWGAMLELGRRGSAIDPVLLESELGDKAGPAGGLLYLSGCLGEVPTADNVEYYAELVTRAAITRRVKLACSELLNAHLEGAELLERTAVVMRPLLELRTPVREPGEDDDKPPAACYGLDALTFLGDDEDEADDSEDWVVRGIILRSAPNVIAGTPKGKKTMVALHLMIAIAAGLETWLGRFPIRAGCRVLVLAHEDSRRETRRRLWRLARGMGIDPRSLSSTLRIADRTEPFHFDRQAEMAKMVSTLETWRPQVVLMDSMSRMHGLDENSKREMGIVTEAWLDLAARYDLALVSIHHLVKVSETKDLILQLRGSGDIGAAVRHAVGVAKNAEDPTRSKIWTDGNEQYHPDPFDVVVADGVDARGKPTITLRVEESDDQKYIDAALVAIRAAMPAGLSSTELRQALKCKGERADGAASALEALGKIYRGGVRSKWRLQEGA